jgi:hypothetical protein
MAYDPKARVGVIMLTNQVGDVGDIARHLLRPDFPLAKPANTKHIEIALDSKVWILTSAARFVIREFCLLTFLSVVAGIAPLNSRSPFHNLLLCCSGVRPTSFKRCWEKIVNARNQPGWPSVSSDDGNAAEEGVGATKLRN